MHAPDTAGPLTTQAVPPPHTSSPLRTPSLPGSQPTGGPRHAARSVVTDDVPNHPACEAMRAGRLDHHDTGARRQREGDRLPRQSAIGHAHRPAGRAGHAWHWAAARAAGAMRRSRVCIVWGLCLVTLVAGGMAGAGSPSAAGMPPACPVPRRTRRRPQQGCPRPTSRPLTTPLRQQGAGPMGTCPCPLKPITGRVLRSYSSCPVGAGIRCF